MGMRELILIAQDLRLMAGSGGKGCAARIIEKILQAAPENTGLEFYTRFQDFLRSAHRSDGSNPTVLPYLDIPLQHAHPAVLKRMHRPMIWLGQRKPFAKCGSESRNRNPLYLYRRIPEETDEEFMSLYDFLTEMKFDRVGVFPYYLEEGTSSAAYGETVPEEIKRNALICLCPPAGNFS
jgi:ribosomal protein S12 methylthiotransferase